MRCFQQLFLFTILIAFNGFVHAQQLYTKTFGAASGKPLLFLHGGPGGSALDFELTTAPELAKKGFFVIVYDRRGEGRSEYDSAKFTFEETFSDMLNIYEQYKIKSATLLGHSFGGIVATKFAEQYPARVNSLILAGAPLSLPKMFRTILSNVQNSATDSTLKKQLHEVKGYDTASIHYSSGCFMLAMQARLYNTKNPGEKAQRLYRELMQHEAMKQYTALLTATHYKTMLNPTMGFWKNEKYTSLNITGSLNKVSKENIPVYAIYGKEDGLFSTDHINTLRGIIGNESRVLYLDDCSHGVFMDQQDAFIASITDWLK
ncbi:MAG: alpha/beta fold hydrolase [Chitinophagaceae bacterium]